MTGVGTVLRFLLRRERRALPIWVVAAAGLPLVQSVQSQSFYDTPEKLAKLRETSEGNAALIAMQGPTDLLANVGGESVFEVFAFAALVVATMNLFLVGRNTRADEESGRAELLRSTPVGRHTLLLAALALAGLADLAVAVAVAGLTAASGLPLAGSVLHGLALGGVGLVFAGLSAVAVQLFEGARAAYGTVIALLGLAFALRAVGDVGSEWVSWLSPIGWGQRTLPYVGNRWWVLVLPVLTAALLVGVAFAVLDRRDFGSGVLAARPGRASARAGLGSPAGLAWRLQRGALLGWAAGSLLLGVMFGSVGPSIQSYVDDNPDIAGYLPGGGREVLDAYLTLVLAVTVLLAAAFAVWGVLRLRAEETSGHAEPVLATAVSRPAWLGGQVVVALAGGVVVLLSGVLGVAVTFGLTMGDPGQIPRVLGAGLVYVPAVLLVGTVAAALVAWVPPAAAPVAWTVLGYLTVVTWLGDALRLPAWARDLSPIARSPQAPLDPVTATPLVVIAVLAALVVGSALVGVRRRDLRT